MKKYFAYTLAAFAFVLTSRVWAGPSCAAMSSETLASPSSTPADLHPAVNGFAELTPLRDPQAGTADDFLIDADEMSPTDPHPMIPLPPAVWAGFAGLALVAKRVLRRSAATA